MKATGAPETTLGLRTYHLHRFLRETKRDPLTLDTEDLVAWVASHDWKPNTIRSYRASLRAFYTWAQATGRRPDNPALSMPRVPIPPALPRPTPEIVYLEALLEADERVRLMIELAAACGLRRGEIARIKREDVQIDLEGDFCLLVHGKGRRERVVPLPPPLARQILAMPAGWIFPSVMTSGPLTPAYVGKLVSRAFPPGWTCHNLRHRCFTIALEVCGDIRAVQELAGHAQLNTTQIYTFVRTSRIKRLVEVTGSGPRTDRAA